MAQAGRAQRGPGAVTKGWDAPRGAGQCGEHWDTVLERGLPWVDRGGQMVLTAGDAQAGQWVALAGGAAGWAGVGGAHRRAIR